MTPSSSLYKLPDPPCSDHPRTPTAVGFAVVVVSNSALADFVVSMWTSAVHAGTVYARALPGIPPPHLGKPQVQVGIAIGVGIVMGVYQGIYEAEDCSDSVADQT